jgi:DNA adenine methylase
MATKGKGKSYYYGMEPSRYLKYPGNKDDAYFLGRLAYLRHFMQNKRFIEPFAGSGAVTTAVAHLFKEVLANDANPELIAAHELAIQNPTGFITDLEAVFDGANNEATFRKFRDEYNDPNTQPYRRALLLIYLNRHSYGGGMRSNAEGKYNMPFGKRPSIHFPAEEILGFSSRLKDKATFSQGDYKVLMKQAGKGDFVYLDPPYLPERGKKSTFTSYIGGFTIQDHREMARLALEASERGATVVVSNNDSHLTQRLYATADHLTPILMARPNATDSKPAEEIMARWVARGLPSIGALFSTDNPHYVELLQGKVRARAAGIEFDSEESKRLSKAMWKHAERPQRGDKKLGYLIHSKIVIRGPKSIIEQANAELDEFLKPWAVSMVEECFPSPQISDQGTCLVRVVIGQGLYPEDWAEVAAPNRPSLDILIDSVSSIGSARTRWKKKRFETLIDLAGCFFLEPFSLFADSVVEQSRSANLVTDIMDWLSHANHYGPALENAPTTDDDDAYRAWYANHGEVTVGSAALLVIALGRLVMSLPANTLPLPHPILSHLPRFAVAMRKCALFGTDSDEVNATIRWSQQHLGTAHHDVTTMNTANGRITSFYQRLLCAAEEEDEARVTSLLAEVAANGWQLELEAVDGKPKMEDSFTGVDVTVTLKLGGQIVETWEQRYAGYWGCGGTGWWIENLGTDQPAGMDVLLECADLEVTTPHVPQPEFSDDDEESAE